MSVASSGLTSAFIWWVLDKPNVTLLSKTLTVLTSITLFLTWTIVFADTPPQDIVIVASPADNALT